MGEGYFLSRQGLVAPVWVNRRWILSIDLTFLSRSAVDRSRRCVIVAAHRRERQLSYSLFNRIFGEKPWRTLD